MPKLKVCDLVFGSLLILAVASSAVVMVRDSITEGGHERLWTACRHGDVAQLRDLFARGARLEGMPTESRTPLHVAASFLHKDVVELLLQRGADVNALDMHGMPPIAHAAGNIYVHHWGRGKRRSEVVEALLRGGARTTIPDRPTDFLVTLAATAGYRDTAELLAQSVDIGLHMAAALGHTDKLRALVDRGGNVLAKDNRGWVPLHWAAYRWADAETVTFLLTKGCPADVRDETGDTPLHKAAGGGNLAAAEVLLRAGAPVDARDSRGDTPLHGAADEGNEHVAELLLRAGAVVDARNQYGRTPLHEAAGHQHADAARLLLGSGADPNARDDHGWTPLLQVAYARLEELALPMASMLLEAGASVGAADDAGNTPLSVAKERGMRQFEGVLRRGQRQPPASGRQKQETPQSPPTPGVKDD